MNERPPSSYLPFLLVTAKISGRDPATRVLIVVLTGLLTLALAGTLAASAQARYLSHASAYRVATKDALEAKYDNEADDWGVGVCWRKARGRIDCPVAITGDEFYDYIPGTYDLDNYVPARYIYYHFRCDWTVLIWSPGRKRVIFYRDVRRVCDEWYDRSPSQ